MWKIGFNCGPGIDQTKCRIRNISKAEVRDPVEGTGRRLRLGGKLGQITIDFGRA